MTALEVAATGLSRNAIRVLTKKVREISGCDKEPYFPVVEFIEFVLGNPDYPDFDFEIVDPEEMDNMYGTTNTDTNVMKIREDVYLRAKQGVPRDRFTLCHELGHYFLHQPQFVSYARGEIPRYCNPE